MKHIINKLELIQNFYHQYFNDLATIFGKKKFEENSGFDNNFFLLKNEFENINLNEKPLQIAVVGNFSTGKSTFINSLLEEELLGMKIEPSTAKITHLVFDETFKIEKCYKNDIIEKISLEEYQKASVHNHNTQKQSTEVDNISHYRISYNKPILNKINIYDTPGFSSLSNEDDNLTKEWITKADLLLWLIDINEGGKADELINIKTFEDKPIIIVINKADDVFETTRKKIQNNIADNFKHDNLLYAAKPILEYKINQKNNKLNFNKIIEKANQFLDEGAIFNIDFSKENIVLNVNSEDLKIERFQTFFDDDLKIYLEYYNNLTEKFLEIKNNINSIKYKNLEIKLNHLFDKENVRLNNISTKLCDKLKKEEQDYNTIKCKLEGQFKHISEKSKEDFKNFRTNLFNKIYDEIFIHNFEEGGWFSSDKHIVKIKDFNKTKINQIEQIIDKAFGDFYQKIIQDTKKLMNKTQLTLNEDIYEIQIIKFLKDTYVAASVDSLIALFNIWTDREYENFSGVELNLKRQIDLAIADERIYDTTLTLLEIVYNNEIKNLHYEKEEQLNHINNLIMIIKNI